MAPDRSSRKRKAPSRPAEPSPIPSEEEELQNGDLDGILSHSEDDDEDGVGSDEEGNPVWGSDSDEEGFDEEDESDLEDEDACFFFSARERDWDRDCGCEWGCDCDRHAARRSCSSSSEYSEKCDLTRSRLRVFA